MHPWILPSVTVGDVIDMQFHRPYLGLAFIYRNPPCYYLHDKYSEAIDVIMWCCITEDSRNLGQFI